MAHASSNFNEYPCYCHPTPDCVAVVNNNDTPATLSEGVLTAGGLTFNYFDIMDVTLTCNADPVAQVVHANPSGFTVGTCCGETATYELMLQSNTCGGEPLRSTYSITYNSDVTASAIVADFVAAINADDAAFVTASTSGTNIVLTADTAGCAFSVVFATDNFIITTVTANVAAFGEASQVTADGGTPLTSTTDYHAIDILYRSFEDDSEGCGNCLKVCKKLCRIYVIDAAAGDSFITSVADITDGTDTVSKYLAKNVAAASFVCA